MQIGISLEAVTEVRDNAVSWLQKNTKKYVKHNEYDKAILFFVCRQYILSSYCVKYNDRVADESVCRLEYGEKGFGFVSELFTYCSALESIDVTSKADSLPVICSSLTHTIVQFLEDAGLELEDWDV